MVVALTIPVVVSTTFILMYEAGILLRQKVSLGALILSLGGLLVDDAIIVVEMMSVSSKKVKGHFRICYLRYTNQQPSLCYIWYAHYLCWLLTISTRVEAWWQSLQNLYPSLYLWLSSYLGLPLFSSALFSAIKSSKTRLQNLNPNGPNGDRIMHNLSVTFYDKFERLFTLGFRTS